MSRKQEWAWGSVALAKRLATRPWKENKDKQLAERAFRGKGFSNLSVASTFCCSARRSALITGQAIRRGSFDSVGRLERAIMRWLVHWNEHARPFHWTKSAAAIRRSLDNVTAIYETDTS